MLFLFLPEHHRFFPYNTPKHGSSKSTLIHLRFSFVGFPFVFFLAFSHSLMEISKTDLKDLQRLEEKTTSQHQ